MSVTSVDTKIQGLDSLMGKDRLSAKDGKGTSFKDTLESQVSGLDKLKEKKEHVVQTLKFSNHAVERMSKRGISFSPDQMTKIEGAVNKAIQKGAKEALIFSDDAALIVSLKNNTVVTVMDKSSLKENVFTNIDSTVVV